MANAIRTKKEAVNRYIQHKIKDVKLFQEDIPTNSKTGAKRFYVLDPNIIYNKIVSNSKAHFYEFWTDSMKIEFALDLDMNFIDNYSKSLKIVKKNILKVCEGINKYYELDYDISKIIVLESDSRYSVEESNKYSYRVIFRGISFQNHLVAKDFYKRLHEEYNIEYSDMSIYGQTCLRLCYSSKYGKKAVLIPVELEINGIKTMTDMNTSLTPYDFFLRTMITQTYSYEPEIKQTQMKTPISKMKVKVELDNSNKINTSVSNVKLEEILFQLPSDYYNDYSKWIKVGMSLLSLETEETGQTYFCLWDRWSKQSQKYDEREAEKVWNNLKKSEKKISIGSLIHWCKNEGIVDIFKKTKSSFYDIIGTYPVKPIKLDIENIQQENILEINQAKLIPQIYKPYLNKRLICVQSEKGTGKTSNLFEALFDKANNSINPDTTMLFISSRRTFGVKLLGDLEKYGFKLYSDIADPDIHAKRIICQIDSLGRLSRDTYDYVIIDECESLARYITSSHFIKNPKSNIIVANLEMRVENAKKIIIMDADLSDRCFGYYKTIINDSDLDYQLIINNFKPFNDYTIVSLTYNDWVRKVLEAISQNKKIVVPMASNNKAKDLKTKIEQDYPDKKILLIHKETDDYEKVKNLLNVNTTWGDYDVIIYTPSVCMGVSYDIPNVFDSIYAYGCENSLGAQEFCQMLHRVREPINKTIYLAMSLYKEYNEIEDLMTYESVEQVLCSDYYLTHYELNNNLIPIKLKNEEVDGQINRVLHYPYKSDPNYDLFVRNSWETIENKLNFSASFYGYAKFKEYKLSHYLYEEKCTEISDSMKEIKKTRENEEKETSINGILEAPDISKEDFISLLKQKDEYLEDKDIQAINRFRFKSCYKILEENELTHDVLEEYNTKDKMKWYYNLTNIIATENQTTPEKLEIMKTNIINDKWINSCYMDFTNKNIYINHLFATYIIHLCGFDINNFDITIAQSDLETNLLSCINYIDSNKKEIAYKFNLNTYNKNIIDIELKDQIKLINSIVYSQYGLKIKKITKSTKGQDASNIMYQLTNDNIWDQLPKDNKIEAFDLYDRNNTVQETKKYNLVLLNFLNEDEDSQDILPCEGEI
jgi:hypothetical protein